MAQTENVDASKDTTIALVMEESLEAYRQLREPFDSTYKLPGSNGKTFDYGEQSTYIERLNDVLGVDGWEFRILASGVDPDSVWVHGQITAYLPARPVVREQFGECIMSKGMKIGDARKGAASDALKKAASLLSVGLYLMGKDDEKRAQLIAEHQQGQPASTGQKVAQNNAQAQPAADPNKDENGWPICKTVLDLASDPGGVEADALKRKKPQDLQLIQLAGRVRGTEDPEKLTSLKEEVKAAKAKAQISPDGFGHLVWLMKNRHRLSTEAAGKPAEPSA